MRITYISILLLIYLCSCHKSENPSTTILPVDSFLVRDYTDISEMLNMFYTSDSTLISFSFRGNELITYVLNNHFFQKKQLFRIPIKAQIQSFNKLANNTYLLISSDNKHYLLDSSYNIRPLYLNDRKQHLDTSFLNCGFQYHPIIQLNNSIICTYYYQHLSQYPQYYLEPTLAEYTLSKDSLNFIRSYLEKPKGLIKHRLPFAKYCFDGKENIYLLYPPYDSLYILNISDKRETVIAINNLDYSKPELYDMNKMRESKYRSQEHHYMLENFVYHSVYFNPVTSHLVLFYSSPTDSKNGQQVLKALVLDTAFKAIGYFKFGEKSFFDTENFFVIPNKGIAMPIYDNNKNVKHENIQYYIYNF